MATIPIKTVSTPIFNTTTLSFQNTQSPSNQYGGFSSALAQQQALKQSIAESQKQNPEKFQNYEKTTNYVNQNDEKYIQTVKQPTQQASPIIAQRPLPTKKQHITIEKIQQIKPIQGPQQIKSIQNQGQISINAVAQQTPSQYNPLGDFAKGATNIFRDYGGILDPNYKSKSIINQGFEGILSGNRDGELSRVSDRIVRNPLQFAGELAVEAPLFILPIGPAVRAIKSVAVATKTILKGRQMLAHPEVLTKYTPKQIEAVERLVDTAPNDPIAFKKLEGMVKGLDKNIQKDIDKQLKTQISPEQLKRQIKNAQQIKKPDTFKSELDGEKYTFSPGGFSQTKAQVAEMDRLKQIASDKSLPKSTRDNAIKMIEKYTSKVYPPKTDFTDANALRNVGLGLGGLGTVVGLGSNKAYADSGLGSPDPFNIFGKVTSDAQNFLIPQSKSRKQPVRMSSYKPLPIRKPLQKIQYKSKEQISNEQKYLAPFGGSKELALTNEMMKSQQLYPNAWEGKYKDPKTQGYLGGVNIPNTSMKSGYSNDPDNKYDNNIIYGMIGNVQKQPTIKLGGGPKPLPPKPKYEVVTKDGKRRIFNTSEAAIKFSKGKQGVQIMSSSAPKTFVKPKPPIQKNNEIFNSFTNFFNGPQLAYADTGIPEQKRQGIFDVLNPFKDPFNSTPTVVATPIQNQNVTTVKTPQGIKVTFNGKTRIFKDQKSADEFTRRYNNPTPRQPPPIKPQQRDLMAEYNNEISTNSINGTYIGKPVTADMLAKIGNNKSIQNKSKTELALEQQRLNREMNSKQNIVSINYNPMSRESLEKIANSGINKSYNSQQFLNYYDKNRKEDGLFANPYFGKPLGYKLPEYGKPKPK